ncbi:MAG TPA: hypothetical protein VK689_10625, partial [Armatimonadota bacterium]|nr:hypothetical protein [Armatimonadota bacterium]
MALSIRPSLTFVLPSLLASLLVCAASASGAGAERQLESLRSGAGTTVLELEINPESRVKVARVGALPTLIQGRWRPCLIRVHNAAGATAPLRVEDASSGAAWLSAQGSHSQSGLSWKLEPDSQAGTHLTGASEEYRVLSFHASTPGWRTASLRFNIGQGTGDLGFRAEVDLPFQIAAADTPAGPSPQAPGVEAQPLLAHVQRVREALEVLGEPLPPARLALLESAGREPADAAVAARVQEALDPLCLAELQVRPDGAVAVARGEALPALHEQGWRTFLVKVRNAAGATGSLRVTSPNARQVPNGPASEVGRRWLDLNVVESPP